MPAVTVKVNSSGLPIASAHSPTLVESELPKPTVGRLRASIRITATSVLGSVPTTLAVNSRLRSEEHTSELQSHSDLVCRLLLEKKNNEQREGDNDVHAAGASVAP